jgi:hypothetical protein
MTAVEIIPFRPWHLHAMDMRETEQQGVFKVDDVKERFGVLAEVGIAAGTFVRKNEILFCAGFHKLWAGVFEVWMVPSAYVARVPFVVGRLAKRYIDRIECDFKAHRIQTTSYDDPFHERWMGFLGFKKEGVLRKYMPDQTNMCVYGRVK